MVSNNRITNVVVVGAGGNSGKHIAQQLLATGQHNLTALTRADSTASIPAGIKAIVIDYDNEDSLVDALRGQDALVITLKAGLHGLHSQLVKAAAKAGVPWIVPNQWGPDTQDPAVNADMPMRLLDVVGQHFAEIAALGVSSYVSFATGFWYEMSLATPDGFGFDLKNRHVTFFDEGTARVTVSTWPQIGRAVAALLSLPVHAEGGDERRSLDALRNQQVYIGSFTTTQQEMFASVLRVMGTTREEWEITHEPSQQRYAAAIEGLKSGLDLSAFARALYSRHFYPDPQVGDFEQRRGLINDILGLNTEDLDEATRAAVQRSKSVDGW